MLYIIIATSFEMAFLLLVHKVMAHEEGHNAIP